MTSKDIEAELERDPFIPIRLHMVSGKTLDIPGPGVAFPMQNALLVLQRRQPGRVRLDGYDVVSFRNIERIEQLHSESSDAA
ncbi:MAG TPA: hypothetical protein VEA69_02005 [Tepidisphaeraceae bacterium]|nr:hypothetical protein [Tepidisphaeraceae bacterium]